MKKWIVKHHEGKEYGIYNQDTISWLFFSFSVVKLRKCVNLLKRQKWNKK